MAVACAALSAALFVYQPWRSLPFQIVDFSEFLPALIGGGSVRERLGAFTEYYAQRGRFNPIQHALTVLYWSVFGWNAAGWQILRFCWMFGLAAGVFFLLRRLVSGLAGPFAGASLFLFSSATVDHWLAPHLAEPVGFVFILGATWLAASYSDSARWHTRAVAIACLLGLAMLTKEMLAATIPFVLAVGCCWHHGAPRAPRLGRRELALVGAVALASAAAAVPIVLTYLRTPADGYAQVYGDAGPDTARVAAWARVMLLPSRVAWMSLAKALLYPANTCFLAVLLAGTTFLARGPASRRRAGTVLSLVAVSLPVAGVVAYLPWPNVFDYYGFPFLLGPALLVAGALAVIDGSASVPVRWASYGACAAIVLFTGVSAHRQARERAARRLVDDAAARALSEYASRGTVLVGLNYPLPPHQRWQGFAETLGRYSRLIGASPPPAMMDVACADAAPIARRMPADTVVLVYAGSCAEFPRQVPKPVRSVRRMYDYYSWKTFRRVRDSVRADFWDAIGSRAEPARLVPTGATSARGRAGEGRSE
ncbi:MAG: hypothetical protein WKG32_07840 [Gemmatimonadaceae bacterium]